MTRGQWIEDNISQYYLHNSLHVKSFIVIYVTEYSGEGTIYTWPNIGTHLATFKMHFDFLLKLHVLQRICNWNHEVNNLLTNIADVIVYVKNNDKF